MKKTSNHFTNGFTLIEVVVTLAIIVVILGIGVTRTNRMNSKSNINLTAEAMISDLRSTAMSALNTEKFQGQYPTAWGIQIESTTNPSSYTIFADLNGDQIYSNNEKFKTVVLAKGVKLLCTSFNGVCVVSGSLVFNVPDAQTYFYNGVDVRKVNGDSGDVVVQLQDTSTQDTKNISINPVGTVSLD